MRCGPALGLRRAAITARVPPPGRSRAKALFTRGQFRLFLGMTAPFSSNLGLMMKLTINTTCERSASLILPAATKASKAKPS